MKSDEYLNRKGLKQTKTKKNMMLRSMTLTEELRTIHEVVCDEYLGMISVWCVMMTDSISQTVVAILNLHLQVDQAETTFHHYVSMLA